MVPHTTRTATYVSGALFTLLAGSVACSGNGGGGVSPTVGQPNSPAPVLQGQSVSIPLAQIGSLPLPAVGGIASTITLSQNDAPIGATLTISVSTELPSGMQNVPATHSATFEYLTLKSSSNVTFKAFPKVALTLPSPAKSHGRFYAWMYNVSATTWTDLGTVTVVGSTISFGGSNASITLKSGVPYVVVAFTADVGNACPTPTPSPVATQLLYAGSQNQIQAYPAGVVGGNPSPVSTLTGSNTTLGHEPDGIAFDSRGNMYVANNPNGISQACILEFGPGASGNTAPIATICGPHTQLGTDSADVAIDREGNIYVSNLFDNKIVVFASGAHGDVAPKFTICGSLSRVFQPNGIAIDASGNLFVANTTPEIDEYAAGASGNVAPVAEISGPATMITSPHGIAFDSHGNLFVTNEAAVFPFTESILRFAPGASGNVAPAGQIVGNMTQLDEPFRIAFDSSGLLYVSNASEINIFSGDANGNVAPLETISSFPLTFRGVAVH